MQTLPTAAFDEHVFLAGRPPITEFIGYITRVAPDGDLIDKGKLAEEWRIANDRVRQLEQTEPSLADHPSIKPISAEFSALVDRVLSDPGVRRSFELLPLRLASVDIDRLVVSQKSINLRFVKELKQRLGADPSALTVFHLALGLDRELPAVSATKTSGNSYTFVSVSNDFRFMETAIEI